MDAAIIDPRTDVSEYVNMVRDDDSDRSCPRGVDDFGHAKDFHALHVAKKLKFALKKRRLQENLPPLCQTKTFYPTVIAFWNRYKGGQDVVSRLLKNVKVDFRKLSPRACIYIRLIMTSMLNCHMVWRIFKLVQTDYRGGDVLSK
jgi:hypothetical protein